MTPFTFLHSTHALRFGAGCLDEIATALSGHGAKRVALVCDGFFLDSPIEARLRTLFEQADATDVTVHAVANGEPDVAAVETCADALRAANPQAIIALGGGSAMDTAKVARMLLSNPGPVTAIAGPVGVVMAPHPSLFACVPTTAGTGSEVSESAIVSAGTDYKLVFRSPQMSARLALLDPKLTVSAPPEVTAASGYDAVTHAVEAYTSNWANPITDPLALAALETLARCLPLAYREPDNLDARGGCLLASAQAAIAFNSANLGLAHAIAGALGALHHVGHGLANALALPWTMAYNQPVLGEKGERIASILGADTAAHGLSKLRHTLDLDISLDRFVENDAARDRLAQGASTSGQIKMNPRPAGVAELRVIIEAMRRPTGGGQPHLNL